MAKFEVIIAMLALMQMNVALKMIHCGRAINSFLLLFENRLYLVFQNF